MRRPNVAKPPPATNSATNAGRCRSGESFSDFRRKERPISNSRWTSLTGFVIFFFPALNFHTDGVARCLFFSSTNVPNSYAATGNGTHGRVAPDWGLLKDALPNKLQGRGWTSSHPNVNSNKGTHSTEKYCPVHKLASKGLNQSSLGALVLIKSKFDLRCQFLSAKCNNIAFITN